MLTHPLKAADTALPTAGARAPRRSKITQPASRLRFGMFIQGVELLSCWPKVSSGSTLHGGDERRGDAGERRSCLVGLANMAHDMIGDENRKLFARMGAPAVRTKADSGGFDVSQLVAAHLWLEENDRKSANITLSIATAAVVIAALVLLAATIKT
jgi:hypothetical protein